MSETIQATGGSQLEAGAIAEDLMCLSCGYNLRGLERMGACRECGSRIMKTIVARQGITKRELAALICKIIAIWYVFKLLLESLEILRFMADSLFTLLTTVFTFTLYLGLLYLMWYKSELIAKWLIVNDGPLSLTGRFMANQIMPIALGLIGVMYVIYGLSGVCWTASTLLMQTGNDYWVSSLIHATFNLLIGWVLLFGAARISKVVLWLRLAGTGLNK